MEVGGKKKNRRKPMEESISKKMVFNAAKSCQ